MYKKKKKEMCLDLCKQCEINRPLLIFLSMCQLTRQARICVYRRTYIDLYYLTRGRPFDKRSILQQFNQVVDSTFVI